MESGEHSQLEFIIALITRELITRGCNPPEIVDISDMDEGTEVIHITLSSHNHKALKQVASVHGTTVETVARSIINANAAFLHSRAEKGS